MEIVVIADSHPLFHEEQWEKGDFQVIPTHPSNVLGMLRSLFPSPFLRTSQKFQIQGRNSPQQLLGGGQIPVSFPPFSWIFPRSTSSPFHNQSISSDPWIQVPPFPHGRELQAAPKALPHPRRIPGEKAVAQSQGICSKPPKSMDSIPNFPAGTLRAPAHPTS